MPDNSPPPRFSLLSLARVYRALLNAAWATALEYRAQAVLWILSFLFPLVMMAVWLAVVDEVGPAAGWDRADFVSYYVGAAMVNHLTFAWIVWDWDEDIRTGKLSVKLLKPLDPFHHLLSEQLGWKLFILLIIFPIVAVIAWLSPVISYPLTPGRAIACALSVVAGFVLSMCMNSAFGVLAFWSPQVRNLYSLWHGVGQFLSGWIAPLALFPAGFRQVAYLLPFRNTLGFPMEILMGRLNWSEIELGFAVAGSWALAFLILYRVLWRIGLRRYEAVGA
jgi:ABC-2 type transport system permease protein